MNAVVYVFSTCVSLLQERYMDGTQAGGLLYLAKGEMRASLKAGYYVRVSCILMRWSDGLHLVAHYCYDLDIGDTDGLSALINFNEQVNNVIP